MDRSQSHQKRYSGSIILGSQPLNWIKHHHSFASREWFESQIRYGQWIRERKSSYKFLLYATVLEGIKTLEILIKITYHPQGTINCNFDHVLVNHAHVLRKKKK